ncbi:MAG: FAD-binding protein, partial [Ruminiclostridium sp.]|nr:FAD-binding protein [Ruminiclostridium sp.]
METDILIAGSGCSGLYCALHLPRDKRVTVVTKADAESSDSYLAQGGICCLKDDNDYDAFFEDTLKAGHYENDRESVDIMIRSSQAVIDDLIELGVDFQRETDGSLAFTKEGAHSDKRILFHEDITGQEITSKLLARAKERENITILEYTTLVDVIEEEGICRGAVVRKADGTLETVSAGYTVLATGGVGGLYRFSTNFRHLTGDALAIA